uniref:NADH-quinone oxidoreductase subunit C n=1 Tax=Altererythrobacter segetis TaxID=1104773 RepID=UPI00140A6C47|nr:NADH-quinone oxidoreductase subunit C [Altererythrobacter segetis]
MATVLHPAPKISSNEGVRETLVKALGKRVLASKEMHGEIVIGVEREAIEDVLRTLRDEHGYQQLMEIAGVDYPEREERFEVVYMLLSLTRNHRIMVKLRAAENTPVPTVTRLWPNAGWLEREVFDMYGVLFDGNTDLRRILTDYGFEGHPQRKDFPLTGFQELRYSEEEHRVVYEPVELPQDFRTFDFMSPWEGADYVLPGDEKSVTPPPAPQPKPVPEPSGKVDAKAPETRGAPGVSTPKTTGKASETGAGKRADKKAATKKSSAAPAKKVTAKKAPAAPKPTSSRPARKPKGPKA